MNSRVVTAHIPVDLAEQVDLLSTRLDRPKGWIVRQALTSWVALEAKRHQLTLEGLADVDAGRVVDHASVAAWAESLDHSG
ncbi:CopG family ribbon-helix-helix protein [Crenothrix polyspora]|jgi:predicted transcriptional regulator|uniref:Ribbon-helix-helix protein, copG family protein n=1 Tax=Crenothrix polyspora TaxID=360316 RepID=A0A1R4H4K0_9GAMM|nr:ribbon-helix-helix domain-containing protein [Crenothrix polyspora]SJM90951.1 Ribbon-helix-helix protein, copG family protein [Crenothrix polyspora]